MTPRRNERKSVLRSKSKDFAHVAVSNQTPALCEDARSRASVIRHEDPEQAG